MDVQVHGVLRFKHRAGLEKGLAAFDDNAYPEFFKSELWALSGPYAECRRTFEIEPDCDYTDAFLAMAREAVEGVIYLREGDKAKQFVRITKLGRPINRWTKFEDDARTRKFGAEATDLMKSWAEAMAEAATAASTKAAQDAKREARKQAKSKVSAHVVELPANPSRVIALRDGALAIATGSKVCFVAPTGEITATVDCALGEYDMFGMGITRLHGLDDGRVLAFQELASEARLVDRAMPQATAIKSDGERTIKDGTSAGPLTVLRALHSALVLGPATSIAHTLTPWPDDYLRCVALWRGGTLAATSSNTAWFDANGVQKFAVAGELALTRDETFVVYRDDGVLAMIDDAGADVRTIAIGDVGHGAAEDDYPRSWAMRGDRFIATTRWPSRVREWNLTDGSLTWQHDNTHESMPGGLIATDTLVATWSPPPYIRAKDTSILVTAGDREVARLDAKAPVIGMTAIGDDTLVAFVEGRTAGSKLFVWRDAATTPKLETLSGHKGRLRGVLALPDRRLVSWAADKTVRIWQL